MRGNGNGWAPFLPGWRKRVVERRLCLCAACTKAHSTRADAKQRALAELRRSPFLRKDKTP